MDQFMDFGPEERLLRRESIHPGIFAIPALVFLVEMVAALPIVFFVKTMENMTKQLNPQGAPAGFNFFWVIVAFVWFLPTVAVCVLVLMGYVKSEVLLTDRRLIYRIGFLVRAGGELPLENVDAIFLLEPLLGRLFGYGTVAVSSVGGAQFALRFIGRPQVLHAMLQQAVAKAKVPARREAVVAQDDSRYMPRG